MYEERWMFLLMVEARLDATGECDDVAAGAGAGLLLPPHENMVAS